MAAFQTLDQIKDLDGEIWKPILQYDAKYLVSNYGRVKSYKNRTAIIMHQQKNNQGYYRVPLSKDGKTKYELTHRLVAAAFVPNDDPEVKNTVDHIDADKNNNCASNLRWLSLADNIRAYYALRKHLRENDDEAVLHTL